MTWTNEHRPDALADVVGQPTDQIRQLIEEADGTPPNLLLYGPPATGKTSTARAIAHEMHGDTKQLFEVNASDERGIDTIRDEIGELARLDAGAQYTLSMKRPIILLDEADAMTKEAQQALRVPMEDSAAMFILTANDQDGIHDAIQSRCHGGGFRFDYPPEADVVTRLREIADAEEMEIADSKLRQIARRSGGDMRTAIDLLEQSHRFGAVEVQTASEPSESNRDDISSDAEEFL
jgi:DNA polymerase III delta prime subunit